MEIMTTWYKRKDSVHSIAQTLKSAITTYSVKDNSSSKDRSNSTAIESHNNKNEGYDGQVREHPRPADQHAWNGRFYSEDLSSSTFDGPNPNIRLLQIAPGEHQDPLSCELTSYNLRSSPKYEALSYCWGDLKKAEWCKIAINGTNSFRVTRHLLQALLRFRYTDRARLIWIDAICINQASLFERSHQVNLMRSLYNRASAVIVWLGELDSTQPSCKTHTSEFFDGAVAVCADPGLSALEHQNIERILGEKITADEKRSTSRSSLGEVWWKRIWVVQEFTVSRAVVVYLGPHAVDWALFEDVLQREVKQAYSFDLLRGAASKSLYTLFSSTHNIFYSTEPRDKIYALLGLASTQGKRIPIIPDYSKSVTHVLEETWQYLIDTERTLDILLDQRVRRHNLGKPSWIPDLHEFKDRTEVSTQDKFRASGTILPEAELEEGNSLECSVPSCPKVTTRVLRLQGLRLDRVIQSVKVEDCVESRNISWRPPGAHAVNWNAILDVLLPPLIGGSASSSDPRSRLEPGPFIGYLLLKYIWEDTRSIVESRKDVVTAFKEAEDRWELFGSGKRHPGLINASGLSHVEKAHAVRRRDHLEKLAQKRGVCVSEALREDFAVAAVAERDLLRKIR